MINIFEVNETNNMVQHENLDVRTITMGISLLDCIDSDLNRLNEKIYEKITTKAEKLVEIKGFRLHLSHLWVLLRAERQTIL